LVTTQITIAPAQPADAVAMADLLAEMDRFYGAASTVPLAERVQQVSDAVFTSPTAAQMLLAWDGDRLAALAAYSFLWPAVGLTRSLYLKELYVAGRYRGQGIGRRLMRAVFDTAAKHGCSRVEWTTDRDNVGAQAFYQQLGVPVHSSKIFYRVEDSGPWAELPK
jgi:GNAT superfamily N-acetyltransferase